MQTQIYYESFMDPKSITTHFILLVGWYHSIASNTSHKLLESMNAIEVKWYHIISKSENDWKWGYKIEVKLNHLFWMVSRGKEINCITSSCSQCTSCNNFLIKLLTKSASIIHFEKVIPCSSCFLAIQLKRSFEHRVVCNLWHQCLRN